MSNGFNPNQDDLSVLICVKIVCKGYQQMTKIFPSSWKRVRESVKLSLLFRRFIFHRINHNFLSKNVLIKKLKYLLNLKLIS